MRGSGRGMERERKTGQLEGCDERKGEVHGVDAQRTLPQAGPCSSVVP